MGKGRYEVSQVGLAIVPGQAVLSENRAAVCTLYATLSPFPTPFGN